MVFMSNRIANCSVLFPSFDAHTENNANEIFKQYHLALVKIDQD